MAPRQQTALVAGLIAGLFALALLVVTAGLVAGLAAGVRPSSPSCAEGGADPASSGWSGPREIPPRLVPLYRRAAAAYRLGRDGWAWLAGVNRIETDFGRDLAISPAGAIGWMQFEPATWARYGVDADGDGRKDPYDPADAIAGAARYLRALGAPADWQGALRAYAGGPANARSPATLAYWRSVVRHVTAYVGASPDGQPVAAPAHAGGADECAAAGAIPVPPADRARIEPDGRAAAPASTPAGVRAMIAAGNELVGRPYVYGGGHADFRLSPGYDCSSSVSWVLHGAGLLRFPEDSITLEGFGAAGAGRWVTVYTNAVHAFLNVAGIRLDTSTRPGDGRLDQPGPRWRPATRSTAGFVARHPPGL